MTSNSGIRVVQANSDHADYFVQRWVPFNFNARFKDPAWSYYLFPWDEILGRPEYATFAAVDSAGNVEGFLATQAQQDFVKVCFLSTAPSNFGPNKARRGIGSGLLSYAIEHSIALGFGGQITLSSTQESESFYEKIGLVRTGQLDEEDLVVFELPRKVVPKILHRYPALRQEASYV